MRKHLLIILITLFSAKINAQCTVATPSVSENFSANVLPTCWTAHNSTGVATNEMYFYGGSFSPMIVLPKTDNAKGIITFKARNNPAFGAPTVAIGAVVNPGSPASFVTIQTFAVSNSTMITFTINLSSYAGNYQYIAITLPGNQNRRLHLDDVNYQSACFSSSVTAIAQNYTVQLNSNGQKNITGSNIDNGSITTCGAPTLGVSPSFFDCSNIGINTVTLTASDNNGHNSFTTASVTVLPAINNETISATQSTICSGNSSTVTTGSSKNGIKYYLRDDANDNVIAGPVTGTGSALSLNTGPLTANTTFNVYAETQGGGNYGLDFDGTNDVITTTITTTVTNSLTVEAWIFPRATTHKRIVSNYYNNAAQSGEIILDTYNATNNGRGLRFVVEGAGNTLHQLSSPNVLTLNAWNHVAGTFSNGVTKIYVNGTAVATSTAPFTSIPGCAHTISIGEDPTIGALEYFNGKMDDIRIWNTARTQSEISGNMNNCLNGNESGLKNYFKLNENTGSTTSDLITGTIGNMSGITPASAWVVGNVDCGGASCDFEMTQTVAINVNQAPTVSVVSNSSLLCVGQTASLTASGASTYTWNSGATTSDIAISPTVTTSYTVNGTDANGCTNTSVITQSVSTCTGINQVINNNNTMTLFPNPSSSNITVQTDETIQTIYIFNMLGDLAQTENANTFSVAQLSSGIYIIHVKTEKGINTLRFIKE